MAWVQFLVGELKSCKVHSVVKIKMMMMILKDTSL